MWDEHSLQLHVGVQAGALEEAGHQELVRVRAESSLSLQVCQVEVWTPRQGRPRYTLVSWIPYAQLVPLGGGALPYSPVHRSDAGEEVRQASGLHSLLMQVQWRRARGRAHF